MLLRDCRRACRNSFEESLMKLNKKTMSLYALLFAVFVLTLTTRFTERAGAYTCLPGVPRLYAYAEEKSWAQNTQVTVKIDDSWTDATDRQAFAAGMTKWNNDCSGVNFSGFDTQHFTDSDYDEHIAPPNGSVY